MDYTPQNYVEQRPTGAFNPNYQMPDLSYQWDQGSMPDSQFSYTPQNYVEQRALGANRTPIGPVDITKPRTPAAPTPAKSPQVSGGFINTTSPEWANRRAKFTGSSELAKSEWANRYADAKTKFAALSPEEQKRIRERDAYSKQFML